jgi:hypothetical protein
MKDNKVCLLDIPKKGLHFVVISMNETTNEIIDINNPDPIDCKYGEFIKAKQAGVNTIFDIGYTLKEWQSDYGDFHFKNHCSI